jgi:D-glycero-alpha-D-manno-heptose-7-phosphate kinase
VRELIKLSNVKSNLDITHHGDLPARSGIGSSSSFTVGLIHALETFCEKMPNKRQLALNAINLEQNILCENVGSQDQITASFGGFNKIKFGGPQEFICENIPINDEKINTKHKIKLANLYNTFYNGSEDYNNKFIELID